MRKNNINLRVLFIMLLSIVMIKTNAQTGLNFQGVARTTNNVILASQAITIKLSILQGSSTGTADYVETRKVMTNAQGLFTAVIGDTGAISTLGNFTTINWKLSPKFLKIEMDAAAGNNFITMGTTQFQYVAYAQFAKSVDAENIVGIVPVTLGGTGVNSLTGLKTALTLNNVSNTTDLTKPISTLTQTALDLKLNAADTSKYTKQTYTDSALLTKLSITGNAVTATTAGNITATTNTTLTSLSSLATVGTITSGVWSGTAVAVEKGGTGATTASAARTNLGLVIGTNVQAPLVAGTDYLVPTGSAASLTNFPTFNQSTTGNAVTATTAGNITATTNTTLTSLSNLATVGTITSGVWSGTAVTVAKGGTGLTAAGTNGQILTSTNAGTLTWTTPVFLPTVVIGTQQWMEKNLDVMTYRNGDVIPQVTSNAAWAALTTGAWCWYNNSADNGAIYGKLYNWYAVNDARGLAPQGWHIPTDAEWTTLGTLLGGNSVAGGKMKTTGITRWNSPNTSATNQSGFAGLPGGQRVIDGRFFSLGESGHWWSVTGLTSTYAEYRYLLDVSDGLRGGSGIYANKVNGFSVRCLRD